MKHKSQNGRRIKSNNSTRRVVQVAALDRSKKLDALGTQLLIEMHECLVDRIDDVDWVEEVMSEAAKRAQARIVNTVFHKFNPVGISGVVVIAESHIAIHIWPEYRYAALDIFSCGSAFKMSEAASFVVEQFRCIHHSVTEVQRGLLSHIAGLRGSQIAAKENYRERKPSSAVV